MKFAYIRRPMPFVLGVCAFAWAVGFARYFDQWIYFPAFPNIFDSMGLCLVGAFLLYEGFSRGGHNPKDAPDRELKRILSVFDDIDGAKES